MVLVWMVFAGLMMDMVIGDDAVETRVDTHVHAEWNFKDGLSGWGKSSELENGMEISVEQGKLRATLWPSDELAGPPFIDSPLMKLESRDREYVVIRMSYAGLRDARGGFGVRTLRSADWMDRQSLPKSQGRDDWIEDETSGFVQFDEVVSNDGKFHVYHAPLYQHVYGYVAQLRLFPALDLSDNMKRTKVFAGGQSSVVIDWIRIIKAPTIFKVEGCINKYFPSKHLGFGTNASHPIPYHPDFSRMFRPEDGFLLHRGSGGGFSRIHGTEMWANDDKHVFIVTTQQTMDEMPIGTTYNCLHGGGERIRISGKNLGYLHTSNHASRDSFVSIGVDRVPCTEPVYVVDQEQVECTLPPAPKSPTHWERQFVWIHHPEYPGLVHKEPFLSYMVPPPKVLNVNVSNIAAHSAALTWTLPEDYWDAITITGYVVEYRTVSTQGSAGFETASILGNVTSTTITGLISNTIYEFRVAALAEDQMYKSNPEIGEHPDWHEVDLYGRRPMVPGALIGKFSEPTPRIKTLLSDFSFSFFDADSTLDHGPKDPRSSVDPTRQEHGEGHFGLLMVGDANIENCNTTHACCDGFAPGANLTSSCSATCSNIAPADLEFGEYEPSDVDSQSFLNVTKNRHGDGIFISKTIPEGLGVSYNITNSCGPALRLTSSHARMSGAAWYRRQMNVREGFVTEFTFRISNPSLVCRVMDDVHTHCRSRGADGFAFVVQTEGPFALGHPGDQLGFGGINDAIALEFDTFFNHEVLDPYENHVSLIARGFGENITSDHTFELGGSVAPQDLTDGTHRVRIEYSPIFEQELLFTPWFVAGAHLESFIGTSNPENKQAWSSGMGVLKVYLNNMKTPLFVTPLNLESTLTKLHSGRAWVGFTAATGDSFWQAHDILSWSFTSSRLN